MTRLHPSSAFAAALLHLSTPASAATVESAALQAVVAAVQAGHPAVPSISATL